jgi:serine/threonine protein kinase
MGEVYKARDTRLDRTVAVKVLPAHLAADPELRARFEREARAIAALSHPNICTVHDVGRHEETDYLVMEYLEGQTLADRVAQAKGPLPLEQVLAIGTAIADALDRAHRAGIVHRDLKPGNVMLTKSGPKLLDFGLAKLRGPATPISLSGMTRMAASPATAKGTILGTIHYMAPEQVEGREADTRCDIWALGALLYEMATGRRPFEGESAASVIGAILKDVPPVVSTRQPLAPTALDHLVERCLEKDADERWQDARDVKRELVWIASARSRPGADIPLPRSGHRSVALWLAACVVVAAALGATALMRPRQNGSSPVRTVLSIVPPDNVRPGGSFALSPDGRHFAFVGLSGDGAATLWVRSMDSPTSRQLPGTEDASYPFWSPQSEAIGFFAGGKLKTVAMVGGAAPKTLASVQNGRGGAWGADGTILYSTQASPLLRVSDKGGPSTPATSLDLQHRQIAHRWPAFVDSRHFVYTAQGVGDATGIYLGSLDSPASTRLVGNYSNSAFIGGHLLFELDGALVSQSLDVNGGRMVGGTVEVAGTVAFSAGMGFAAFSASSTGVLAYTAGGAASASEMSWFDRQGKRLVQLGADTGVTQYISYGERLSPDGRTLAFAAFRLPTADIWLVDIGRDVASRFTFDEAGEINPVWSPDGAALLFSSNRSGFYNLYRKAVSASGEETLLFKSATHQYSTDWSRDGRTILFANIDPETLSDIWMVPATGDGKPIPVLVTAFNEYSARLSPDGRWMAYTSDESGRPEVYVQRFPTATGKVQISTQGGSEPSWRGDGRELFYVAANRTLTAATVTTAPDFSAGRPTKLFDTVVDTSLGVINAPHYAATADGQRFLMNVSATSQTPTTIVLNWASGLKP